MNNVVEPPEYQVPSRAELADVLLRNRALPSSAGLRKLEADPAWQLLGKEVQALSARELAKEAIRGPWRSFDSLTSEEWTELVMHAAQVVTDLHPKECSHFCHFLDRHLRANLQKGEGRELCRTFLESAADVFDWHVTLRPFKLTARRNPRDLSFMPEQARLWSKLIGNVGFSFGNLKQAGIVSKTRQWIQDGYQEIAEKYQKNKSAGIPYHRFDTLSGRN